MAFDACRAAVVSMKLGLELFVISHKHLSESILTVDELKTLCEEANKMEVMLRDAMEEWYIDDEISDAVVSLKADLNVLICKENLYVKTSLMESKLKYSLGESYYKSQIREAVVSTKMDLKPLFCREEFRKLLVASLLLEKRYPVRGKLISIKTSLEKEMEPLLRKEFQMLYNNVMKMESLLVASMGEDHNNDMAKKFQDQIRVVAGEVANQLHFMDQFEKFDSNPLTLIRQWRGSVGHSFLTLIRQCIGSVGHSFDLTAFLKLTQETVSINKELKMFHGVSNLDLIASTGPQHSEPTRGKMVSLANNLPEMLNRLIRSSETLEVLPIIGMAGIGKTTLAKALYDHPTAMHHFDVRACVMVSQDYEPRELLSRLLRCITNFSYTTYQMDGEQLGEQLYGSLKQRRYLILFDDVWDERVWGNLKLYLPDDMNGSRVLLTSQIGHVATRACPYRPPYCVQFLSPNESWELLCSMIFPNEPCPIELLPIGKKIAYECQGLPQAIVIAGQLLSQTEKITAALLNAAQDVCSLIMGDPHYWSSIIGHLPDQLKECFLYMGVFPQHYGIPSGELICLWIAEGFVQPIANKTLEEVAEGYLESLIDRSLVMVKRKWSNGRIETCHIHNLLRDMCLRESQKVKFLHVVGKDDRMILRHEIFKEGWSKHRRLAIHSDLSIFLNEIASLPFASSFFSFKAHNPVNLEASSGIFFEVLEILDMMNVCLVSLPSWLQFLTKLKYLALTIQNSVVLIELAKLRRLQTCIIEGQWSGYLSEEFWDMSELRHFHLGSRSLHSYCEYGFNGEVTAMQHLQSLSAVSPASCTREIFESMPNLKKLGVYENIGDYRFHGWVKNLVHLPKLETLKYALSNPFSTSRLIRPEQPLHYIHCRSLKKLTLSGTSFLWEDIYMLSLLHKLEELKLKNHAFKGSVWNVGEFSFGCLKLLLIGSTNLEEWEADDSNYPRLQRLVLRHCRLLNEIPFGIRQLPLLEKIELHGCSDSAAASARKLREYRHKYRADELAVYITKG